MKCMCTQMSTPLPSAELSCCPFNRCFYHLKWLTGH